MYIYIYYMGKFDHERTLFSRALEIMVYVRKIIPFYGRKIQVSEILQFTHIYIYIYIHDFPSYGLPYVISQPCWEI